MQVFFGKDNICLLCRAFSTLALKKDKELLFYWLKCFVMWVPYCWPLNRFFSYEISWGITEWQL